VHHEWASAANGTCERRRPETVISSGAIRKRARPTAWGAERFATTRAQGRLQVGFGFDAASAATSLNAS
jgi:hypothetical protein